MSEPTKDGEFVCCNVFRPCYGPTCKHHADNLPATPLPAPDPMDEVVGRVSNALSGADYDARFRWEGEWLCADDLRALLAAYQSVRSENIDLWTELELCRKMCRTGGTE